MAGPPEIPWSAELHQKIAYDQTTDGERYEAMIDDHSVKRNSGLNGIRTHDLCDIGAVLYQLSYQANTEMVHGFECRSGLNSFQIDR